MWRNTGGGFTNVPVAGLPGNFDSSVSWGDYDNDGRLDFLVAGTIEGGTVSQLWHKSAGSWLRLLPHEQYWTSTKTGASARATFGMRRAAISTSESQPLHRENTFAIRQRLPRVPTSPRPKRSVGKSP